MLSPDLTAWLEAHGLGAYSEAFAANEIALGDLPLLSDADLRELGLPMGPRRRLIAAVATIGASPEVEAESTTSVNAPARSMPRFRWPRPSAQKVPACALSYRRIVEQALRWHSRSRP
jgi:hypothetical protein